MTHLAAQNWKSVIFPRFSILLFFFFSLSCRLASHHSHLSSGHGAAQCYRRYCTVLFAWLSSICNESCCGRSLGQNSMRKCCNKAYIISLSKRRRERSETPRVPFYSTWHWLLVSYKHFFFFFRYYWHLTWLATKRQAYKVFPKMDSITVCSCNIHRYTDQSLKAILFYPHFRLHKSACLHGVFLWQKTLTGHRGALRVCAHIAFSFGWKSTGFIQVLHKGKKKKRYHFPMTTIAWNHFTTNQRTVNCLKGSSLIDCSTFSRGGCMWCYVLSSHR